MTAIVRSELSKIRSTRTLTAVPATAILYGALSVAPALGLSSEKMAGTTLDDVVRGPASFVAFAMLVLGVLVVTSEMRHGTLGSALAVVPDRRSLARAKASAVALTATVAAIGAAAVSAVAGVALLRSNDLPLGATSDALATALGVVAVAVLYGAAGVGLGLLVRDQTAAVGVAIGWVTVVEGVLPVVLRTPEVSTWLPAGAAKAAVTLADTSGELLPPPIGLALLVAYGLVLIGTGTALFQARDVR